MLHAVAYNFPVDADTQSTQLDYSAWRISPLREGDLDQLMAIEVYSFPTPWKRGMYEQDLRTNTHSRFYCVKHQASGELAAYIGSWFIYEEAHVGTIATKREYRGLRLAEQLIAYTALERAKRGAELCHPRSARQQSVGDPAVPAAGVRAGRVAARLLHRYR